jgi:hypothetical protein
MRGGIGDAAGIERLAAFLASLHPAWADRRWQEIGEETRALFREDARRAVVVYQGIA